MKLLVAVIGIVVFSNVSAGSKKFELHQAVIDKDISLVTRLLSKGAEINELGSRSFGNGSALHLAVREGHIKIAKLLLDRGAEVDVLDPFDVTPLHNAAWNGNLEMTELLLDAGADIEASTYDGDTPLSLAQNNNQPKVAEFIQAKLQPSATSEAKVESVSVSDSGVIDVSGTYISEITGDSLRLPSKKPNPEVRLVQNGNEITGSFESGGKIWGEIEGDTIKFDFLTPGGGTGRGEWTVKPESNEMVGNWSETHRGGGKWNLTKIEAEPAQVVDISGNYVSEITTNKNDYFGNIKSKLVFALEQNGDRITAVNTAKNLKIRGTRKGNLIEFFVEPHPMNWRQYTNGIWEINPDGINIKGSWEVHSRGAAGQFNLRKVE